MELWITKPMVRKVCLVGGHSKTRMPSLVLHMKLLYKTENVNKDRVQVFSKGANACFCPMEPQM